MRKGQFKSYPLINNNSGQTICLSLSRPPSPVVLWKSFTVWGFLGWVFRALIMPRLSRLSQSYWPCAWEEEGWWDWPWTVETGKAYVVSDGDIAYAQMVRRTECFYWPVLNYERAFSFCPRSPWALGGKEVNLWMVCADRRASSVINTLIEWSLCNF